MLQSRGKNQKWATSEPSGYITPASWGATGEMSGSDSGDSGGHMDHELYDSGLEGYRMVEVSKNFF